MPVEEPAPGAIDEQAPPPPVSDETQKVELPPPPRGVTPQGRSRSRGRGNGRRRGRRAAAAPRPLLPRPLLPRSSRRTPPRPRPASRPDRRRRLDGRPGADRPGSRHSQPPHAPDRHDGARHRRGRAPRDRRRRDRGLRLPALGQHQRHAESRADPADLPHGPRRSERRDHRPATRASSRPAGSTCRSRCRTRSRRRASASRRRRPRARSRSRNVDFTASNTIAGGQRRQHPVGRPLPDRPDHHRRPSPARRPARCFPTEADVGVTAVKAGEAGNVAAEHDHGDPAGRGSAHAVGPEQGRDERRHPQGVPAGLPGRRRRRARQARHGARRRVPRGRRRRQPARPQNAQVYPDTAVLGDPTTSVDPATLVGQALPTFDLGLNATGSVIAVDASPVEGVARSRLMANVGSDYRLVDGSVDIEQGPATVTNGQVSVPGHGLGVARPRPRPGAAPRARQGQVARGREGRARAVRRGDDHPVARLGLDGPDASIRGSASRSSARTDRRAPSSRPVIARRIAARRQRDARDPAPRGRSRRTADRARDRGPRRGSAFALTTLNRAGDPAADAAAIARVAAEQAVDELVVGLPLARERATKARRRRVTREWVAAVAPILGLPVTFRDERLTSHLAESAGRSHETGPFRRAADASPARRLSRPDRSRGCRDHPPGRAGRTSSGCRRDRRHERPRDEHDQARAGPTRTDNDTETPR